MGDLELVETLVEYDGPRVVVCKSSTDQLYLAGWAEEGDSVDTWLFVPISPARHAMTRSGGLRLRVAFENPEGVVYVVRLPVDSNAAVTFELRSGQTLDDSWLPNPQFSLDLDTPTVPRASDGAEIERLAKQEGRARFRLRVHLPDRTRSEAPTRRIGDLLVSTQNVFDNIGHAQLQSDPAQSGRIPNDVVAQMATDLVGLTAASFVLELGSTDGNDLLGDSPFLRAAGTLVDLLAVALPSEDLMDRLVQLRPRGAKSFRTFVGDLTATGADVTLAVAGAAQKYKEQNLTASQLDNLKALLTQIVPDDAREIRGRMRLYRYDLDRRQFGLRDLHSDETYEGKIADRAIPQMDHAPSNGVYDVVISATVQFDQAVGDRKPKYVLEQLFLSESEVPLPAVITEIKDVPSATF